MVLIRVKLIIGGYLTGPFFGGIALIQGGCLLEALICTLFLAQVVLFFALPLYLCSLFCTDLKLGDFESSFS